MDDRFIDEHNSSSSGHSVWDPEMNQNQLRTSVNIEEEESTEVIQPKKVNKKQEEEPKKMQKSNGTVVNAKNKKKN